MRMVIIMAYVHLVFGAVGADSPVVSMGVPSQ